MKILPGCYWFTHSEILTEQSDQNGTSNHSGSHPSQLQNGCCTTGGRRHRDFLKPWTLPAHPWMLLGGSQLMPGLPVTMFLCIQITISHIPRQSNALECQSFPLFCAFMKRIFDRSATRQATSRQLHQGNRSVSDYSIEFRTLDTAANWNT